MVLEPASVWETEETTWRGRLKSDRSPLNSSGTILDEAEPVRKATREKSNENAAKTISCQQLQIRSQDVMQMIEFAFSLLLFLCYPLHILHSSGHFQKLQRLIFSCRAPTAAASSLKMLERHLTFRSQIFHHSSASCIDFLRFAKVRSVEKSALKCPAPNLHLSN